MEKVANKEYKLIGKIESINKGQAFCNMTFILEDDSRINIKLEDFDDSVLYVGKVYQVECIGVAKNEDVVLKITEAKPVEEICSGTELEKICLKFYKYAPIPMNVLQKEIEKKISRIENPVIRKITNSIYKKNKNMFYTHPAGTKFHHAYVGGLGYHTLTMLKLADPYVEIYPFLNKDLIYAGIILHDMGKLKEITGVDGEYTTEGQLLGHLVMEAIDINLEASKLGFSDKEEALLLKHMIISHHGQYNFGSPKKPMTAEAMLLWYIDSIDSKLTALGDELENTNKGEWTSVIAMLDKMKFYKHKL